nr:hypothetical protein [Leifsonia poae]
MELTGLPRTEQIADVERGEDQQHDRGDDRDGRARADLEVGEGGQVGPHAEGRRRVVRSALRDEPDLVEDVEVPDDRQHSDEQQRRLEEVEHDREVGAPFARAVEAGRLEVGGVDLGLRSIRGEGDERHGLPHDEHPDAGEGEPGVVRPGEVGEVAEEVRLGEQPVDDAVARLEQPVPDLRGGDVGHAPGEDEHDGHDVAHPGAEAGEDLRDPDADHQAADHECRGEEHREDERPPEVRVDEDLCVLRESDAAELTGEQGALVVVGERGEDQEDDRHRDQREHDDPGRAQEPEGAVRDCLE